MPELSLNLDPLGGLWPVMPAQAATPDEEPAIDFGALLLIQAQPFVPVVPASSEQPGFSPADAVVPVPAAQPGMIPADPVGLKPNGSEEKAVIPDARYVVRDERPAAPEARPVSSEQPGVSPADPVGLRPDGSEKIAVMPDARSVVRDERPAAPEARHVLSEQPDFSAADAVELKPDGSEEKAVAPEVHRVRSVQPGLSAPVSVAHVQPEQPSVSPADPVRQTPERSEETPAVRQLHQVMSDQRSVAPEVRQVSSEPPAVSPAVSVGLKPHGSDEKPNGSAEKPNGFEASPGVSDARPIVRAEHPVAPEVRRVFSEQPRMSSADPAPSVSSEQPGFSPAEPVEQKPTGSGEKPSPSKAPTVFSTGSIPQVTQGAQAAQAVAPALAQAPLQTMVPTTEDGAPVMPRLVEMMRWQAQEGGGQAELRLRPEFLGAVTVSIVVERGAVKAIVSAETPAALEYLRADMSSLQEALEERGLTLDEFEVREEVPRAERRRDPEDAPPRRDTVPPAPHRRARDEDGGAVFNVLM